MFSNIRIQFGFEPVCFCTWLSISQAIIHLESELLFKVSLPVKSIHVTICYLWLLKVWYENLKTHKLHSLWVIYLFLAFQWALDLHKHTRWLQDHLHSQTQSLVSPVLEHQLQGQLLRKKVINFSSKHDIWIRKC